MKIITPSDLVPMDSFEKDEPLRVDLAYARPDNLLFGEAIYKKEARLWLHPILANVVREAAQICFRQHGYGFILYDGLRTVDAQEKMLKTQRVLDNPHWLQEPRLLSPPGAGGHPRGMAIDVGLEDEHGVLLDMGTPFDFLAEDARPEHNPAHRAYVHLTEEIKKNRSLLTDSMTIAAKTLNTPLVPLPQEWWDFRLPASMYEQYAPLSDDDLPPEMRMVG